VGLTYDQRWKIRWARDKQARWRVWREDIIARELEEIESQGRSLRAAARRDREYEWTLALPGLLAEWQAREEAA
jgi:hypothetical protein